MSILDRLQRIVRAEWTARSGDRPSPPASVAELRGVVQDARRSLASVRAEERRLHRDYQAALDDAQRYEDIAVEALRRHDEDSAHEALRRKQPVDERVKALRRALDQQQRELSDIKSALEALRMRIDASRERDAAQTPSPAPAVPRFYASAAPSEATSAPPPDPPPSAPAPTTDEPLTTFGLAGPLSRLDELGHQIADLEASVEASRLLDPSASERALDARFERLSRERSLDEARRDAEASEGDDPLQRLRDRMEEP